MIDVADIMVCIDVLTSLLPTLRDSLNLTQREFASIIGISRQSVIDLEHKNRKITRAVLIATITFFSLRRESAMILYDEGFYDLRYVSSLGFTPSTIQKVFDLNEGGT